MSSNVISSAEIERRKKEELRRQEEERSLSNAFNIKLANIIEEEKKKGLDVLSKESFSKKTYIQIFVNDKLHNEIKSLQSLKIEKFSLSYQELKKNRNIAETKLNEILKSYHNEINVFLNEMNNNKIETNKYNEINNVINSLSNSVLYFYDIDLDDYKDINILKKKIYSEIELFLESNDLLFEDKEYLLNKRIYLENENNEIKLTRAIESYVQERKKIIKNLLNIHDLYYQYVALNNEYNNLKNTENDAINIKDFINVDEIQKRIDVIMHNICEIKENNYIFESILEVCKLHGFNIINYNQETTKTKLLHKNQNKTALKITNNKKKYSFEILSLKKGENSNGISRDYSDDISDTIKDRIAFCSIHPELVKDLEKKFGIKLNICEHNENPYHDPCNKVEIDEEIFKKLIGAEEKEKEQKIKYESM